MSEERKGGPKRVAEDEHGPFLRVSLFEFLSGLLAIVGAIVGGWVFLWSEIKEIRGTYSTLSQEDVKIKGDSDRLGKDLHETQSRLGEWYEEVFTDYCRFHNGEFIPDHFACEFKDGKPPLPFRNMKLLPPP